MATARASTLTTTTTDTTMNTDAQAGQFAEQKQMLADAILMLERAQVIDFNGHFSWRVPGRDCMLINSGRSVRSALTARRHRH